MLARLSDMALFISLYRLTTNWLSLPNIASAISLSDYNPIRVYMILKGENIEQWKRIKISGRTRVLRQPRQQRSLSIFFLAPFLLSCAIIGENNAVRSNVAMALFIELSSP